MNQAMTTRGFSDDDKESIAQKNDLVKYAAAQGMKLKRKGDEYWGLCPFHEEKTPSFSINSDKQVFCCFGCNKKGDVFDFVMLERGCTFPESVAYLADRCGYQLPDQPGKDEFFDYVDESGALLFQVVRKHPKKDFRQRRPDKKGGWLWQTKGTRQVIYRLPEVLEAVKNNQPVFVVEGEKDADRLRSMGLVATTSPGGAGRWKDSYATWFQSAHVRVLADNDEPGHQHAFDVATKLRNSAASIKVVALPGLPPKGDVSDWLDYGNTRNDLVAYVRKTEKWDGQQGFAKVAQVSQGSRSDFAKDNGEQKQGSISEKSNFRNFRSKFNLKNEEVDQLPILPVLPDAIPFPQTSFDETIDAVQDRTQAPRVLCAQSVLAAATLAVQHLADIEIPGIGGEGARRPISSFFMTIAASGERKSSVDRIVLEGIEQAQISMESFYKDQLTKHEEDVWEYEQALRRAKNEKNGSYSDVPVEPEPPREPIFLVKEPTQEGLFRSLKRGQLSQGLFNDEGGAFLGGYGMSKDNRMRTAATFNSLWDGSKLDRPRATEHETLRGRRFAVHLMIQPKASEQVTGDAMLADLGFTARCLVAEPESTIGTRLFQEPNAHSIEICEFFAQTLQARIEYPTLKNEQGLAPRTITLTENAKQAWVKFYNEIELQLSDRYSSIQGFAGKAPEHVLRLAAMFHLFADPDAQEIGSGAILQSVELVRYYLAQHLRLEAGRPTERDEDADVLMRWLNDKWGEDLVSMADVCRRGPSKIRRREKAERAIEVCVQTGHLKPIEGKHEIKGVTRKQCFKILRESCESSAREEETS